ncbi:MAG: hypothetical protein JSV80_04600, partial [Acidobacteriota bacterium]
MSGSSGKPWRLAVDTGGTFTDAVAVDPEGRRRRVKVLSSGALRGRVRRRVAENAFEVDAGWIGPPELVHGGRFTWLDEQIATARVRRFEPSSSLIELDAPVESPAEAAREIARPFEL